MFFDDHRKRATIIASRRASKTREPIMEPTPMRSEIVRDAQGLPDGKHLAAQDIMAGHHSGSPDQLKRALENFIDLHLSSS